jgi:D-alanine transaminase
MAAPRTRHEWLALLDELVERNGGGDMYTYVQVTRGAEMGRNHAFPAGMAPTVFAMAATLPAVPANLDAYGVAAITTPDLRWARCDIKSTALLPNILAKQLATDAGAAEAILVRDGDVMEGSSMSVFALIDGTLVTPPNSNKILPGTTRDVALELADGLVPIAIRKLPLADLRSAAEIWLGSATRAVIPVVNLDGAAVGPGTPGPVWRRLHERFEALKAQLAGTPAL